MRLLADSLLKTGHRLPFRLLTCIGVCFPILGALSAPLNSPNSSTALNSNALNPTALNPTAESPADDWTSWEKFAETHCLRCHDAETEKGAVNLTALLSSAREGKFEADLFDWRSVRQQLRDRTMPPARDADDEAITPPDEAEVDAALRWLNRELATAIAALPEEAGTVTARRLNRRELMHSLRDITGLEVDLERRLPPDDVGDGFDHIGDVLGLPPMFLEKWIAIAEEVARDAVIVPDEARVPERTWRGSDLNRTGRGQEVAGGQLLWSNGAVSVRHRFPRTGTYRLAFKAYGVQAGPEVVKLALEVGREEKRVFEVPAVRTSPQSYELELSIPRGPRRVGVRFLNDYFQPNHPDRSQRDRNAAILSITIQGPLEGLEPTAFQRQFWEEEPPSSQWRRHLATAIPSLLRQIWRRPASPEQVTEILDLVGRATPPGAPVSAYLRTALVASLASPRFLIRMENDPEELRPGTIRNLDRFERATRLAYFLWGTTPDLELLRLAEEGELDSVTGVRRTAQRMLKDERASSISQAFVPQWLQFSHLSSLRPDRKLFPAVGPKLLEDFQKETIALFEYVRRENRSIWELIDGDYSFLNVRLANHYGLEDLEGLSPQRLRRVTIDSPRGGGLLSQGSLLTATSSPTRTSPTLRGKWLLETLLDAPPPAAPPGAGTLPEAGQPGSELSLRQQLEKHRDEPSCASCHVRMDALGFALEEFDAVGRWRPSLSSDPVDARGELPDGRAVEGIADLRSLLRGDRGFLRALAKNLFVYAIGRGATEEDEPALERCIQRLSQEPTITALVDEIVGLDAFLRRRVPERSSTPLQQSPLSPLEQKEQR